MKMTIAVIVAISIVAFGFGCTGNDYYRPSMIASVRVETKAGKSIIYFSPMAETLYFASGGEIIDETDSEILIRIFRDNIKYNRKPPFPSKMDKVYGWYIDILNPKEKHVLIK